MKKIISILGIVCLSSLMLVIQAQDIINNGNVIEGLSMKSDITGYDVNYSIYLPPCYETSKRFYPVVYLLHGYTDNETAWVQFGQINSTIDKAIASGEIPPMIIVMPDAKVTWYINNYKGTDKYEDMMFDEFIPFVEKQYRIRSKKEFRAVSGLSMGGYGSLIWALRHPDMFGSCAAFSAAVRTDEQQTERLKKEKNYWFTDIYGGTNKDGKLPEHWQTYSVLKIVETLSREEIEKVRFYIDCGDDDFLYKGNSLLHIALRDKNISHQYRIRDGVHSWSYWRNNVIYGLKFIGNGFRR